MSASGTITPSATWVSSPRAPSNGDSSDASTWAEPLQDAANRSEYNRQNGAFLGESNSFTGENTFTDLTNLEHVDVSGNVDIDGTLDVGGDTTLGNVEITGTLEVGGHTQLNGSVEVSLQSFAVDASGGPDFIVDGTTGQISGGPTELTSLTAQTELRLAPSVSGPYTLNASVGSMLLPLGPMVEVHITKDADTDHTVTLQLDDAQLKPGQIYRVAIRHYHPGYGSASHTYIILGHYGAGTAVIRPYSTSHDDAIDIACTQVDPTYHFAFFDLHVIEYVNGTGEVGVIGHKIGPYSTA